MLPFVIPTQLLAFKGAMLKNLDSFIDYFLDDATKQIIKKYDFQELDSGSQQPQNYQNKIRLIGIKVFILYQNSLKRAQLIRIRIVDVKNKYFEVPAHNFYVAVKSHPITVKSLEVAGVLYEICERQAMLLLALISSCIHLVIQKVKKSKLKTHAQDATNRLKRVIEAAFCYTKQTLMFKRSKQLYNYVQGKYGQLKRKFSTLRKEGEMMTEKIASENSCESFMFPEPLEKLSRNKLMKVRSNDNLKKYGQKMRYNKGKIYEVVDEQESSLEMSHRKPSMSEYGGYSSDEEM